MKKLLILILLTIFSCNKDSKEFYIIETTLITGSVDTFNLEVRYNKDLRELEKNAMNSNLFDKEGINMGYDLAMTHPLGLFYKDTLNKTKPSLIEFASMAKDFEDPLGAKLINNTIIFNRSNVLPLHEGKIKSFRILAKNGFPVNSEAVTDYDYELMLFVNNSNVTSAQLDLIPYVTPKAAVNIVNSRPIADAEALNKIPYVSNDAVRRLRQHAKGL